LKPVFRSIPQLTFLKHYFLAILVLNLTACSTLQEVSVENAMRNSKPSGVDSKSFFRYEDMASLKVEGPKNSGEDAWMIIGGILGAAAFIWLIANADSVKVCSPSPCESR
jgi:hypothetical protein